MTNQVVDYLKSHNITVMVSIVCRVIGACVSFVPFVWFQLGDWDKALAVDAVKLAVQAATMSKQLGVGMFTT